MSSDEKEAVTLEDLTCKDCGKNWDGSSWLFQFEGDPDPEKNKLLWVQCPGCQPEPDRFAVSVAEDIHWLPEADI